MIELMGQAAAQATGFGEDFFSCGFTEGEDQFLMLQGCEEGHVVLVIDHNDRKRGPQEFQGTGTSFGVEFLAADPQQKPLQQAIGQQDEDDLIDDQGKGAGGERLQVAKALQLPMPFFNGGTQAILLAGTAGSRIGAVSSSTQ